MCPYWKNVPIFEKWMYPYSNTLVPYFRMYPYSRNRRIEYAHILECANILGIAEYNDTYSVNARYSIFGQDDMAQALTTAHSR